MVDLGTRTLLTVGGYSNDGAGSFVDARPISASFEPSGKGMPLAITKVGPTSAPVEGGVELKITGVGFRPECKYKVRFAVPHPPPAYNPPVAKGENTPANQRIPICLSTTEDFAIVDASYASATSLTCVTPDMSAMLCDGSVLVEACESDGGKQL